MHGRDAESRHLHVQGDVRPVCLGFGRIPGHPQSVLAVPPCRVCGTEAVTGNHEEGAPVLGRAGNDVLATPRGKRGKAGLDGGVDAAAGADSANAQGRNENLAGAKVAPLDEVADEGGHY